MSDIKSYLATNQEKAHETFVHASGGKPSGASSSASSSAKGGGGLVDPISLAVGVITDVGVGVYSTNKQIALQKDIQKLSAGQQKALAEALNKATTKQQKLALLSQAQNDARKQELTKIIIGSTIALVGITLTIILLNRTK